MADKSKGAEFAPSASKKDDGAKRVHLGGDVKHSNESILKGLAINLLPIDETIQLKSLATLQTHPSGGTYINSDPIGKAIEKLSKCVNENKITIDELLDANDSLADYVEVVEKTVASHETRLASLEEAASNLENPTRAQAMRGGLPNPNPGAQNGVAEAIQGFTKMMQEFIKNQQQQPNQQYNLNQSMNVINNANARSSTGVASQGLEDGTGTIGIGRQDDDEEGQQPQQMMMNPVMSPMMMNPMVVSPIMNPMMSMNPILPMSMTPIAVQAVDGNLKDSRETPPSGNTAGVGNLAPGGAPKLMPPGSMAVGNAATGSSAVGNAAVSSSFAPAASFPPAASMMFGGMGTGSFNPMVSGFGMQMDPAAQMMMMANNMLQNLNNATTENNHGMENNNNKNRGSYAGGGQQGWGGGGKSNQLDNSNNNDQAKMNVPTNKKYNVTDEKNIPFSDVIEDLVEWKMRDNERFQKERITDLRNDLLSLSKKLDTERENVRTGPFAHKVNDNILQTQTNTKTITDLVAKVEVLEKTKSDKVQIQNTLAHMGKLMERQDKLESQMELLLPLAEEFAQHGSLSYSNMVFQISELARNFREEMSAFSETVSTRVHAITLDLKKRVLKDEYSSKVKYLEEMRDQIQTSIEQDFAKRYTEKKDIGDLHRKIDRALELFHQTTDGIRPEEYWGMQVKSPFGSVERDHGNYGYGGNSPRLSPGRTGRSGRQLATSTRGRGREVLPAKKTILGDADTSAERKQPYSATTFNEQMVECMHKLPSVGPVPTPNSIPQQFLVDEDMPIRSSSRDHSESWNQKVTPTPPGPSPATKKPKYKGRG